MEFYKIRANNEHGSEWITNIKDNDVVETVCQEELKYITKEYAEKIGVSYDDDVCKELLGDADYVNTYMGDYINLELLDEKALYFDEWTGTFYESDDIRGWDTKKYIYDHDGSDFRMTEILNQKSIEVENIGSVNYNTGCIDTFRVIDSKEIIKVDCSMYGGSRDSVEEKHYSIIEDYHASDQNRK